jgi:hypothetical protein
MFLMMRSARCLCLLAMASSLLFASAQTEGFEELELTGQLEGSTLHFKVNVEDERANGQDTLSLILTVPSLGWASLAFNDNGGNMIGSEAVIGLPDTGEVKKYNLSEKGPGIIPMADDKQTLIEASIIQESGTTTLAFTKLLVEAGEITIDATGVNSFLSSYGTSNILGYHDKREPYTVDLAGGGGVTSSAPSPPTMEQTDAPTAAPPSSGAMVAESTAAGIFVLGAIFTLF